MQFLNLNFYSKDKRVIARADKYKVREYLKEKNSERYLPTLLASWESPEMVELDYLPKSFVLKTNNSSGNNSIMFVKDKSKFKNNKEFINEVRKIWENSKNQLKIFKNNCEYHYLKIKPKLIAQEYLSNFNGDKFIDYKFYCFNGKVDFISAEEGKVEGLKFRKYYNPDWSKSQVFFLDDLPEPSFEYKKPKNLSSMITLAEILSDKFPHMRVDLYEVNDLIYFGELTFTPDACLSKWGSIEMDKFYGYKIELRDFSK